MTHKVATKAGERMFVEISGPFAATTKGSQYHVGIVDDFSRASWSYFIGSKKQIGKAFQSHVREMTTPGNKIKIIRCDNVGENKAYLEPLA